MIPEKAAYVLGSVASGAAGIAAAQSERLSFMGAIMAAIGLDHLSGQEAVAGMFGAVMCGYLMMINTPPEDRTGVVTVVITAAVIGLLGAGLQEWAGNFVHTSIREMHAFAFMSLCGLASRYIVDLFKLTELVKSLMKAFVKSLFTSLRGVK